MKPILFPVLLLLLIIGGCNNAVPLSQLQEPAPIDSFIIEGTPNIEVSVSLLPLNEVTLLSQDYSNDVVRFFRKTAPNRFTLDTIKPFPVKDDVIRSFAIHENHLFFCGSRKKIYCMDTSLAVQKIYHYPIQLPFIKDKFDMISAHSSPFIFLHDTLIGLITHAAAGIPYFNAISAEGTDLMCRLLPDNDTMEILGHGIPRPAEANSFFSFNPIKTRMGNCVAYAFSNPDTIWIYEPHTGLKKAYNLNNPYYNKPALFDYTQLFDNTYKNQYYHNNYRNETVLYDSVHQHLIVFAYMPSSKKNGDSCYLAQVLSTDMKTIAIYRFPDRYFFSYAFIYQGKIALPVRDKRLMLQQQLKYHLYAL